MDALTPDYYSFTLAVGESVTLALTGLSAGDLTLALEDPAGMTLALGHAGATNLDEVISNFVATEAGTYYARIIGTTAARITAWSSPATPTSTPSPTTRIATAQDLISTQVSGRRWAMGAVGGAGGADESSGPPRCRSTCSTGRGSSGTSKGTVTSVTAPSTHTTAAWFT